MFYIIVQLCRLLYKKENFDIVEGTNFITYIPAFFRAKRSGAKAIAWYPDVFIGKGIKNLGLINGIVTEFMERIALVLPWDGVIALSEQTKKKLRQAGVDNKKIEVIYGGVELNSTLEKFNQPTILCISRLVSYKHIEKLLLALYFLRNAVPNISLIIVGNGPQKLQLFKRCLQLGISELVMWKFSISEKEKEILLQRAHLHVLPSLVEGFGLVTIEALCHGTPVVNADISINREILRSKGSGGKSMVMGGLLFHPGDAVDLAENIEALLTNKKLYNQKVSEGKELVKHYEWKKVNKQTETFYQRLLSH